VYRIGSDLGSGSPDEKCGYMDMTQGHGGRRADIIFEVYHDVKHATWLMCVVVAVLA
jgi:hypothetical protein